MTRIRIVINLRDSTQLLIQLVPTTDVSETDCQSDEHALQVPYDSRYAHFNNKIRNFSPRLYLGSYLVSDNLVHRS
jgi:hypothetical protein